MNMNLKSTVIGVALVAAMGASSVASAALYTGWEMLSWGNSNNNLTFSQNLTFNSFDTSLGNLLGVEFSLQFTETLENTAAIIGSPFTATMVGNSTPLTATATIFASGGGTATGQLLTTTNTLTTPGFADFVTPYALNVVGTANSGSVTLSDSLSTADDLSAYLSTTAPEVVIKVTSSGTQGGSVPSNVLTGNRGSVLGTGSIRYLYGTTTVPEPATLGLLGIGLLGGLAASRRRKVAA